MKHVVTLTAFCALFMVAAGLLCYKCYGTCLNQQKINCTAQRNVCMHILYNDETNFKTCMSQSAYEATLVSLNETVIGIDSFSYKCNEDLCNNKSLQDEKCKAVGRLQCTSCKGDCNKPDVAVCTQKQDRCFSFLFEDGYRQKGCVIGRNYKNVFKRANNTHGGLKSESYRCSGMFCNADDTEGEKGQDDGNEREGPEGDALKYCQSLINN